MVLNFAVEPRAQVTNYVERVPEPMSVPSKCRRIDTRIAIHDLGEFSSLAGDLVDLLREVSRSS